MNVLEDYFKIVSSITANNFPSQYMTPISCRKCNASRTLESEYPRTTPSSNTVDFQAKKANAAIPTAETRSLPPIARVAAPPWKAMGEVTAVLVPVGATGVPVPVADVVVLLDAWTYGIETV